MDDIEEGDDGLARLNRKPFSGVAYEVADGERPESELTFQKGLVHGLATDYYPDGRIKLQTEYRFGYRHGLGKEWYDNGILASESKFEFDVLVERRCWDNLGAVTSHFTLTPGDPQYRILEMFRRNRT